MALTRLQPQATDGDVVVILPGEDRHQAESAVPGSAHSATPYGPYRPKHPLGLPQPAMRNEYAHLPSLFLPVSLSHFKGVKDALKEWIR
jgi:hypothetical protein